MEVLDKTQQVIDLIESDLMNVDTGRIARLTGIPIGLYQRIFAYICNISISGYIRRRKLTVAAERLLVKENNITAIAMECGYDSCSAFSRAFKEQFLVPPALITCKHYEEKAFLPLALVDDDSYYVLKGRRVMAELVKIDYEETEDVLLIGIDSREHGVTTDLLWDVFWKGGYDQKLYELRDSWVGMEDCIGLGYMTGFTDETGLGSVYLIGKYCRPGTPVPAGMTGRMITGTTIAKAQIKAANLDDIIQNAYLLIADMVPRNGYTLRYQDFYWSEVYTISRYCNAAKSGAEQVILDFYMPCIRNN